MRPPLTKWWCDVCGEEIPDVSNGYVIWKTDDDLRRYDFKIIHKVKCDLPDHHASAALEDFLGDHGVAYLLSFLSVGLVFEEPDAESPAQIRSISEFVDLFRRVQTPFYEEARIHFADPEVQEQLSDYNEYAPYLPETLERIARDYGDKDR